MTPSGLKLENAMARVWEALAEAGPDGMSKTALCEDCAMTRRQVTRALDGIRAEMTMAQAQPLAYLRPADVYVLSTSWIDEQRPDLLEGIQRLATESLSAKRKLAASWAKWPEHRHNIRRIEMDCDRLIADVNLLIEELGTT